MGDRPDRGGGKRRALDDKNKDNAEDDEAPSIDPGEWKPSGDNEAIRQRRKVAVRRGGPQPAAPTEPAPETAPAASANPFAGVSLTPPSAPIAPANPFAGVSLVAPAQAPAKSEGGPAAEEPEAPEAPSPAAAAAASTTPAAKTSAQAEAEPLEATAPTATTTTAPASLPAPTTAAASTTPATTTQHASGTPAAASTTMPASTTQPAASSNPFSALGSSATTFGAGFGGGGFGGLGAAGKAGAGGFGGGSFGGGAFGDSLAGGSAATGSSGTAPVFGGFNFGAGAFPPIVAPLGAKPAGLKKTEEDWVEGDEQGEGEEAVQVFGAQGPSYQPVVSLPEQEKKTGEEEERQMFAADGSLYEFDIADNKWRERGRGEFKVNASEAGTRMVMRQSGNLRLLLNAKMYANMPVQLMPGNVGVTFGVVNAAATGPSQDEREAAKGKSKATEQREAYAVVMNKPSTWAVRIKNSERVSTLKDLLMKLRENPKAEGVKGTDGGWDAA